jgi:IS5 family transposase
MQKQPSLSLIDGLVVGGGNARLERIDALMDWSALERELAPRGTARTGRPAFSPLVMLKILLLQSWYGLGDPEMEEALGDRLSFRRFVGLSLGEKVPDHSTLCRFRQSVQGQAEAVFAAVNRQLDGHGLMLRHGTLIDATLIPAAVAEPPKQKGGGRSTNDPDAAWTKRGTTATFGYKLHVAVDRGSLLVRAARLTPANRNEVCLGHELVQGDEAAVWADKGYVGPTLRDHLKACGIKNRVQRRAARGRALSRWEVRRNRLIGRIRGRIEGVFGALKRSYGLMRMRYCGLARNAAATLLTLTAWNLARAADRWV